MRKLSRKTGWMRSALTLAALVMLAPASRAVVLDDFVDANLDTAKWEVLGDKTYSLGSSLLTWIDNPESGDWGKGEIAYQQAYFVPPAGETTTVTWVLGPAAVTVDNGGVSVRTQIGLYSDNETAGSREHWANSTGGIWLDVDGILATDPTQAGVHLYVANDTKAYGNNATGIGAAYSAPWNWQAETTTFEVKITSTTFTWYHNGAELGSFAWADYGIDSEFANGFHIWLDGQNNNTGRGTASVDRIEIDNAFAGAGLISSFRSDPPNVIGGATSILRFTVDPAATVDIQPDIGAVTHTGGTGVVTVNTPVVTAATTTVYTLTATVGATEETRQTSLTFYPIPQLPLANFVEEFDGTALNTDLWDTRGDRTLVVTNGVLEVQNNGGNWGHGQVDSDPAYKIPGPGESTKITFVLGPASITTDNGGDSLRYQIGIVSGDESDGWSFEHWKNTTGGTWVDLTGIQSANTNSVGGAIFYANDTKVVDSQGTQIPGGVYLDNWNWQAEPRTITLLLTEAGFTWLDGTDILGGLSWDAVGLDSEFLSGFRIMAAAINFDTGRGVMAYQSITAVSQTGQYAINEIRKTASGVELAWDVESGATYTVRRAPAPDGPWDPVASDLTSDTNRYTDTALPGGDAYYQLVKTPPPALLTAGFEPGEDLSGWTEVAYFDTPLPVWAVGVPTVGPPAAHSGTQVYGTVLDGNYTLLDEVGLQTPVIDLTGVTEATLSFYHWFSLEQDFDHGRIYLLDEAGNRLLPDPIRQVTGVSPGWLFELVPLPAAAIGQRVRLEFYLFSDSVGDDLGWYIDDVEVK